MGHYHLTTEMVFNSLGSLLKKIQDSFLSGDFRGEKLTEAALRNHGLLAKKIFPIIKAYSQIEKILYVPEKGEILCEQLQQDSFDNEDIFLELDLKPLKSNNLYINLGKNLEDISQLPSTISSKTDKNLIKESNSFFNQLEIEFEHFLSDFKNLFEQYKKKQSLN
jgi:hypothetical protein